LCDHGAVDLAYDLLLKDTYPSWGFSIRHGATTIWERWDGWTPERGFQSTNMNSLNHYALGSVGEWLYARVAGIDVDDAAPGFRRIRMRPLPTPRLGWCRASYRSHVGRIASAWRMNGPQVEWSVTIPANCTAAVTLPPHLAEVRTNGERFDDLAIDKRRGDDGSLSFDLASGEYAFSLGRPA
jgi:alpha-L-rhamnosidase